MPRDHDEIERLFDAINLATTSELAEGWGEISEWPRRRIERGDWTGAIWRSPELAQSTAKFAEREELRPLELFDCSAYRTDGPLLGKDYHECSPSADGAFRILKSKSSEAQRRLEASPDAHYEYQKIGIPPVLCKGGYLHVTAGQRTDSARVTATVSHHKHVGIGWMPVTGTTIIQAKALAVFFNATLGRLFLMCTPGRTLNFPKYASSTVNSLPTPSINDQKIVDALADCWEETREEIVPQYRDGYTEIRQHWDKAVCKALGWDIKEISDLGELLAKEPHVSGVGRAQWTT